MSINWVMLDANKAFVPLPRERVLFTSPPRTSLTLSSPNSYPGKSPFSISSSTGAVYVTTQRVIYLPASPTAALQSFAAPLLNFSDTHVTAPFFGPNAWVGILKPVTGGGIPTHHAFVQAKLTFKDGGAYDFHRIYEEVKERTANAVESARAVGRSADLTNVPQEELPAYEERGDGIVAAPRVDEDIVPVVSPRPTRPGQASQLAAPAAAPTATVASPAQSETNPPPNEPPPGYEEAQADGVMNSLEERLRKDSA